MHVVIVCTCISKILVNSTHQTLYIGFFSYPLELIDGIDYVIGFEPEGRYFNVIEHSVIRPIYIGKNQNPKNLGFLLYRLHCQKNP